MTSAASNVVHLDQRRWRHRMKDLCEATGLPRQAIHFYIQQGLLPPGQKTGRNMAWYTDEHLDRLHLIKKLQHERFLPLKAIKALFDGAQDVFSPQQHAFLAGVKERLAASLKTSDQRGETVSAAEVIERTGIEREDVEQALDQGLVGGVRQGSTLRIAAADVWQFEVFGEFRRLGFSKELGFSVQDVAFYQDLITRLFQEEVHLLSSRLSGVPPDQVAAMIEQAVPLIEGLLTRLHQSKIRDFFGDML